MRSYAEIMQDLDAARTAAAALDLAHIEARDVTDEHIAAARKLNAAIREHQETWAARGATKSVVDHAEWVLFDMADLAGTAMSQWVSHYQS